MSRPTCGHCESLTKNNKIQVTNTTIGTSGSCNFCSREILNKDNTNLIYPYKKIFELEGVNIKIRICENCLQELKKVKV
jgi:hypothetical protein